MKHLRITRPIRIENSHLNLIGYIHSTQGIKGDIFAVLKSFDKSWLKKWTELLVQPKSGEVEEKATSSEFLAFEILHLKVHKKQGKTGVILGLQDLDTMTDVEPLVGYSVWIPQDFLKSKKGENIFLKEIDGFTVVDAQLGLIGPIVGFSSNGVQDLIEVSYNNRNHYIPLVKAFVQRIDKKNKKLFMDIPQGLLDL